MRSLLSASAATVRDAVRWQLVARDFSDDGAGALTAGWIFVLLPNLKFSLRRTVLP